jgi:hypothetical protein
MRLTLMFRSVLAIAFLLIASVSNLKLSIVLMENLP